MNATGFTLVRVALVLAASVLLPAQALAQGASTTTRPVKAAVVVQQSSAPAQVVVQTSSASPPAAPATRPAALPAPRLTLEGPASATLGETAAVRAVLLSADGTPVSGAAVDFSTSESFLNTQGSVVFEHAVTDAQGIASADWQPRSNGNLTLTAAFAGDKRFAATTATAAVQVKGDQQLYEQQAGVVVPGLNAAPPFTATAALAPVASPWPRLSGWPVVVVLLIVWALYAKAVSSLFRIALGREPKAAPGEVR